jgi:hypothetical protein
MPNLGTVPLVSPTAKGENFARSASTLATGETSTRLAKIVFLKLQPTEMSDGHHFGTTPQPIKNTMKVL